MNTTIDTLRGNLARTVPALESELDHLADEAGALDLFLAVAGQILIEAGVPGATPREDPPELEVLAFYLRPRMTGPGGHAVSAVQSQRCRAILRSLCQAGIVQVVLPGDGATVDSAGELARRVATHTTFVRGSAYSEQTAARITGVQGWFDKALAGITGIGPRCAVAVLQAIDRAQANRLTAWLPQILAAAEVGADRWREARRTQGRRRTAGQNCLLSECKTAHVAGGRAATELINELATTPWTVVRDDLAIEGLPPSQEEWEALIRLIGLTASNRATMRAGAEVRERPLLVLPDGTVVLMNIAHALDVLWERYDAAARSDADLHERYSRRKSAWLEQKVERCLLRLFPKSAVYRNLTYADPDKPAGRTAEMDAAVVWGPFLVLLEAKAKQFRFESQVGDVARLHSDLKANLEDAFEQARRAVRHIESTSTPVFKEKTGGRELAVSKSRIDRTYLIVVSLHQFAGLATRLTALRPLNLFRDGEYPLAISLNDMEIICEHCQGPDIFLHYVQRRLEVQARAPQVAASEELDLFGAYLEDRLPLERFIDDNGKPYGHVALHGFTDRFDQAVLHKRGIIDTAPEIRLRVPRLIGQLLAELRRDDSDHARHVAFALLDLPDATLTDIARFYAQASADPPAPGTLLRIALEAGGTVVSLAAHGDGDDAVLCDRVRVGGLRHKYRRKAARCIAIGLAAQDPESPLVCADWIDETWAHDDEMERIVEADPAGLVRAGSQLPGRNDPCFCGSGKKYKVCCLRRIERARRQRDASA